MSRSRLTVTGYERHVVLRVDSTGGVEGQLALFQEALRFHRDPWRTSNPIVIEIDPDPVTPEIMDVLVALCQERGPAVATWIRYPEPKIARVYSSANPRQFAVGTEIDFSRSPLLIAGAMQF